jgi:TRAP-type C4-dicarboxylate transport system permease small subunit
MRQTEAGIPVDALARAEGVLASAMRWGSIGCLATLLVLLTAVVFVRFIPVASVGWSDEIVEFAFAWMVFLGAAALWRDRSHFRVELVPQWLAGSWAGRLLEGFLGVLALGFLLVFTYEGWLLTRAANDRTPIFELPKFLWYAVIPLSGAIMIGYTVRDLWCLFRGPARNWGAHE